jgi:glycosyltransferase involved in cell wall biosynthesis
VAALLAVGARPNVIVHTFHGHVLTGYFSTPVSKLFTLIERVLSRLTTCVVAVSEEVREDLLRLGVAPPEKIVVVPLGFDFSRFDVSPAERLGRRIRFRASFGIPPHAQVVTLVGRLEPIKRVDRFLRVANMVEDEQVRFLIVGDGTMREELMQSTDAQRLGSRLIWAGLRSDVPDVYFATDVLMVTSDNEGTAVSAIEALAAGVPVVSTLVGGMPSIVRDGENGFLAASEDETGLRMAIERLQDGELRSRLGRSGASQTRRTLSLDRLVDDIDRLYQRLLDETRPVQPVAWPKRPPVAGQPSKRAHRAFKRK